VKCRYCTKTFAGTDSRKKHTKDFHRRLTLPTVATALVVKEEPVSPGSDDESAHDLHFQPEPPVAKPPKPTSPTNEPEGDGPSANAAVGPFSLRDDPFFPTAAIREELKAVYPDDVAEFVEANWSKMRTRLNSHNVLTSERQVRLSVSNGLLGWELRRALEAIFDRERSAFRIDMAFNTVNREKSSTKLHFGYSEKNSHIYAKMTNGPILVTERSDLDTLFDLMDTTNVFRVSTHCKPVFSIRLPSVFQFASNLRPGSSNTVEAVVGATFYVTRVSQFPLLG